MRYDGTSCGDIDECSHGSHKCDPNANCLNYVKTHDDPYPDFTGYTCECGEGYVGNGYICMPEDADEGLHARTLVSERGRNLCYANMSKQIKGILNSESVTVNEKRLKNVINRIDRLVKAVCADTTKNGNSRTCMDSSYPSKEQAIAFTDIKATKPWLDEMENLIQSKNFKPEVFNKQTGSNLFIIFCISERLQNCKSFKQMQRRHSTIERHIGNIMPA